MQPYHARGLPVPLGQSRGSPDAGRLPDHLHFLPYPDCRILRYHCRRRHHHCCMLLMLLQPLQLLLPPLPLPLRTPFSLSFPPTVLLLIPSFSSFSSTPFSHISFARDPNPTAAADAHVARTQPYAGLPSVRRPEHVRRCLGKARRPCLCYAGRQTAAVSAVRAADAARKRCPLVVDAVVNKAIDALQPPTSRDHGLAGAMKFCSRWRPWTRAC